MRNPTKSHVKRKNVPRAELEKAQHVVLQTLVDAYAQLARMTPQIIRNNDMKRDTDFIVSRVSAEGLHFLTVVLPELGDYFDELVQSGMPSQIPRGFKLNRSRFQQTAFLRPFWVWIYMVVIPRIHTAEQPRELSDAQAKLLRILRTLLLGYKKYISTSSTDDPT